MRHLFRWTLEHPRATLAACALATLLLGAGLLHIEQDTSPEAFLPRGHVSFEDKKAIDHTFHIHDSIVVSVLDRDAPDVFNAQALATVQQVSTFVRNLKGVRAASVRSLGTWEDIQGTDDGVRVTGFLDNLPSRPEDFRHLRERVESFPLYRKLLISDDGRAAFVVADVQEDADIISLFRQVHEHVRDGLDNRRFEIRLTGPPVVTGTLNVYLNEDALRLNPISVLVTVALLWLLFRAGFAVSLPFIVVLPAVACALGSMGYMGARFTPFSNAIPVVVLCIALSDGIHILGTYYEMRLEARDESLTDLLERLLMRLWQPIAWTSLTTAMGFVTLKWTSPMLPVQEFGAAVAVGAVAEMLLSFLALPQALVLLQPEVPARFRERLARQQATGLERLMAALGALCLRRPAWALAPLGLALLLAGVGIARLRGDYNLVDFFPRRSEVYVDHHEIAKRFAGTNFVDLSFDSGQTDGIFEPDFLHRLDALQRDVEAWPGVGKSLSIVPYLKKVNQAVNEDRPEMYAVGASGDVNAQLFFLFSSAGDPSQVDELTDSANRQAHVRLFLRDARFGANRDFLDWLEGRVAAGFPPGSHRIGGEAYVNHHWMRGIRDNVLGSVVLQLSAMLLAGWTLLRNVRAGLLMIVPVTMGIVMTYGFMGLMGIPVGLATSIFASIAIGIGVDYAIHFLHHYRIQREAGWPHAASLLHVMSTTGTLIVGNAATVASGFLVLLLAKTVPPAEIGLFVAVGVFTSLLATLLGLGTLAQFMPVRQAQALPGGTHAEITAPALG